MILFFDTETTGFTSKYKSLTDPVQPHIVQLGAILTTTEGRVVAEMNFMCKPDGWVIPDDVAKIHGMDMSITTEYGFIEAEVVAIFLALCDKAETLVAHNYDYDHEVLKIACARFKHDFVLEKKASYCTMKTATPICKLPSTRGGFKWPKLQEAYKFFFNREFEGAHDAMADIRACKDVFFKLQELSKNASS